MFNLNHFSVVLKIDIFQNQAFKTVKMIFMNSFGYLRLETIRINYVQENRDNKLIMGKYLDLTSGKTLCVAYVQLLNIKLN